MSKSWHTLALFALFQIPLLILCALFGPCSLWATAEYNLTGITFWCLLRRLFWRQSANNMACSLFSTFVVWVLPLLLGVTTLFLRWVGIGVSR